MSSQMYTPPGRIAGRRHSSVTICWTAVCPPSSSTTSIAGSVSRKLLQKVGSD